MQGPWLAALPPLLAALCLASPALATRLYGLIDTGELFSSIDDGVTWTPLSTLPVNDATAMAARLTGSELVLTSRSGSVYRSTDGGLIWTAVGAIPDGDIEDLAVRPDGTLLILTASGSLYSSADTGTSFTALAALTGSNFVSLTFTTLAARYYALTRTGEVYESADDGSTWIAKGTMAVPDACRVRAIRRSLYVLTETGDIYRSTDAAVSWTAVGTLSQVGARGLVRNGNSLVAATREGHVAISPDGVAWTWQGSMNQLSLTALASNEPANTGVEPENGAVSLFMGTPFPNPSRGGLSFALRLERDSRVSIALYDVAGRLVARRDAEPYVAGSHLVRWDPGLTTTGLCFLQLETDAGISITRRWLVVR